MILGEVKARPKDIISFSLDYISKSKVQTSNPSSSPTPLDTPARPADSNNLLHVVAHILEEEAKTVSFLIWVADFVDFTAKITAVCSCDIKMGG